MTAPKWIGASLILLTTLAGPPAARATTHDNKPKVLLHARSVVAKNICSSGQLYTCQEAVTEGTLNTYYNVFVLVDRGNLPNIGGVQFGIDYAGGFNLAGGLKPISVFSWELCGELNFLNPVPAWPAPGSGALIVFEGYYGGCPDYEVNVAGYFYMGAYEPATLSITARPNDQVLMVATCGDVEVVLEAPDDAGYVSFSDTGTPGCNPCNAPCAIVAVEFSTWSRIKAYGGQ